MADCSVRWVCLQREQLYPPPSAALPRALPHSVQEAMRTLGLVHSNAGLVPTTLARAAPFGPSLLRPSTPSPPPATPHALTWACSAVAGEPLATSTSHGRRRHRRPYFLLLASNDARGEYDPPPDNSESDNANTPGGDEPRADADAAAVGGGDGSAGDVPAPRPDEQITANADGGGDASLSSSAVEDAEGEVDWDKAWASTRRRMEEERKDAPAFSGRKQVVATKNGEGAYDFVEISSDGSRKGGGGGFGFADGGQGGTDARGRIRDREQETVDIATTNKVLVLQGGRA